jgi:hypothetical protein
VTHKEVKVLPPRKAGDVKRCVMDPVSQGVVGAAFAQSAAKRTTLATVAWYGALGGMAPDLDVLFQSSSDPLLFWNSIGNLPTRWCLFLSVPCSFSWS